MQCLNYFGPDTEYRAESKVPLLTVWKLEEFNMKSLKITFWAANPERNAT